MNNCMADIVKEDVATISLSIREASRLAGDKGRFSDSETPFARTAEMREDCEFVAVAIR